MGAGVPKHGEHSTTGQLIVSHVLTNNGLTTGRRYSCRLARDTDASERRLYECAQFYRSFPILRAPAKLGWTRCLLLSRVADEPRRHALASQALKHDWPTRVLEQRFSETGVRRVDGATRAELFTYAVTIRRVIDGDTLLVAIEFAPAYKKQMLLRLRGLDCPDVAREREDGQCAALARAQRGCEPAGAPGRRIAQINTAAGRAAKRFVESLVAVGDEVILSTTKPVVASRGTKATLLVSGGTPSIGRPEKYNRSLADVFILKPRSFSQLSALDSQLAADGGEIFLNNALLQNGHAEPYDGGPKDE